MLEFATGVGPLPVDVALRQKSPDVSRGGKKDGEGGEERERTLGVKASTVSHSKLLLGFCLYPINPGRFSNQYRTSADRCTPTLPR